MRALLLLAALAALAPPTARAAPIVSCHCFRERSFDPEKPAAADPYILATTRNSLLSAAFGVPKADLVRAEMTGAAPDDLWVGHWAAARARLPAAALLDARQAKGSWKDALGDAAALLGGAFEQALSRGAGEAELAAIAVDDVLAARAGVDPAHVREARAAGASSAEAILATLTAPRLGGSPGRQLERVRAGSASWGSLLAAAGIAPQQLDGLVRDAVAAAGRRPR
jgi:hypothetical protein